MLYTSATCRLNMLFYINYRRISERIDIMKSFASHIHFLERKAHAPWKAHAAFAIMKSIASLRRRLFRSLFLYQGGRILTLSIIDGG
jgi:hypothetical protein